MAVSTIIDSIAQIPRSKISELQMMLSTDANYGKSVILVEGSDDRKFYTRFVSCKHAVLAVMDGCYRMSQILSMVKEVSELKNMVIGIKDADFDHITCKKYQLDNLFMTDTHDWETMVLTTGCEDNVAIEALGRREPGLFDKVMANLTNYSYIKLYNDVEVLGKDLDGINFKGFSISNVYDGENPCQIDDSLLKVKNHGGNTTKTHFPSESD